MIGQVPSQPIELVHEHDIDLSLLLISTATEKSTQANAISTSGGHTSFDKLLEDDPVSILYKATHGLELCRNR